ncbi:MAG TPA: ATPase, T2SS/T4P/T4SS family [Candidatus Thermoplasmatota archaeon]
MPELRRQDSSASTEGRGVTRVELSDSPVRPPETLAVANGNAEPKRVEIPHEIDSLLGIANDDDREGDGPSDPKRESRVSLAPGTRLEDGAPAPSTPSAPLKTSEALATPTAPSHDADRPARNGHQHVAIDARAGPQDGIPAHASARTRLELSAPATPESPSREPIVASRTVEPSTEAATAATRAPPDLEPSTTVSRTDPPVAAPTPTTKLPDISATAVHLGIDSVPDGPQRPVSAEPTAPVAEKKPKGKQKAVVGSRTRKWLAWFLGNPAHVETVVTAVPALEPHTTQVTLREMVPSTAYARVLFNTERARHHYVVIEPLLDERETRSLEFIKEVLLRTLDIELEIIDRSVAAESLQLLDERVKKVVRDYRMDLSQTSLRRLVYYLRRDFTGYGPVDVMMHDPDIEDISCDGPGTNVFLYHRRYGSMESNVMFATADQLDGFVIRMAQRSGKQITIADPLLDSSLPDGSRLQATLGREVTDNGSTFTIRRFRDNPLSPIDLVRMGTMSAELLAYCWIVVQFGANVMLAGGTASGKTTTLNTISLFIPRQAKIVSIEDTREINLPHKNWVRSVTRGGTRGSDIKRVDMFDLLTAALRQRPEYILVGEVRGKEATVAFQAMATGHTVLGTIHADSPRSVVYRLESEPINIPRIVIQSLDVILMQALLNVAGRRQRRIQEVAEIVGIDPASKELLTHGVFMRNPTNDQLHYTGRSYKLQRIAQRNNWTAAELEGEMKRRSQIINALVAMPTVTFDQIGQLFSMYENRPDAVDGELDRLRSGAAPEGTN